MSDQFWCFYQSYNMSDTGRIVHKSVPSNPLTLEFPQGLCHGPSGGPIPPDSCLPLSTIAGSITELIKKTKFN